MTELPWCRRTGVFVKRGNREVGPNDIYFRVIALGKGNLWFGRLHQGQRPDSLKPTPTGLG